MGLTFDFYTYGGYDIIVYALNSVALMFSDRNWPGIYFGFAAFGLMVRYFFSWGIALKNGMPMGLVEWASTFFWAIVLWAGLIAPTGTLIVYDSQNGKMQSIGNLPAGIVLVAGITNKIQSGLVDIVATGMAPIISYKDAGGGRGFDAFSRLYGFVQNDMKWPDQYDKMSLDRYIDNCVMFYLNTGDINANDFINDSDLFNGIFAQAKSDGVYTVYYSSADTSTRAGTTMTCTDAYNNLRNILTTSYFTSVLEGQFCPNAGYSRDDPSQIQQCLDTYNEHLNKMAGYQNDGAQSLLQMYIAQHVSNYVKKGDTAAIASFTASREMGAGMTGVAIVANTFVPIFMNVMMALAILLTPILFLFFATHPSQSVSYFVGTFMWLLMWGVTDALLHYFAMNNAYTYYTGMRDAPLAYSSIFTFDTTASRVLGILGYMRVLGIMISSSLAFAVLQFGGEAFARVGSSVQGEMEGTGDKAGKVALKPEDQAGYTDGLFKGMGRMDAIKRSRWEDIKGSGEIGAVSEYQKAKQLSEHFGGASQAGMSLGNADSYNQGVGADVVSNKVNSFGGRESAISQETRSRYIEDAKNTIAANKMVDEIKQSTGMKNDYEAVSAIGRMAGMEQAGGIEAIYNTAAAHKMAEAHSTPDSKVSESDIGVFNNAMDKAAERGGDMNALKDRLSTPGSQKLAEDFGVNKEGATLEGIRNNFNQEKLKHAEDASKGMSEFKKFEEYGGFNQSSQQAKSLGLIKDIDGDGKISDFEKGVGMLKFHNMRKAQNEITPDKETAANLRKQGVPVQEGERLKFANDPATGQMTMTDAKGGMHRFKQDGQKESSQYTAEQIRDFAKEAREDGHGLSANYMDFLADRLQKGEAVQMDIQRDNKGNLATFKAEHGGKVEHYDFANRKWGQERDDYHGKTTTKNGEEITMDGGHLSQVGRDNLSYTGIVKDASGESYKGTVLMNGKGEAIDIKREAVDTQRTGLDKQTLNVVTAREEFGKTAQYRLGAENTHGKVFEVAGMKFVAGNVSRQGDQYTIAGTNHLGYGVVMQGRSSSGPEIDTQGKFKGIHDFEVTNVRASKTRDTEISNTYKDVNKLTVDQQDDISMSNLNKIREHYGESPEEFIKNHPEEIAAYGLTKDVLNNFKELMRLRQK